MFLRKAISFNRDHKSSPAVSALRPTKLVINKNKDTEDAFLGMDIKTQNIYVKL